MTIGKGIYESLIQPVLFQMDPEDAHNLVHKMAPALAALPVRFRFAADNLPIELAGVHLQNPIGLAAGFDKNGKLASIVDRLGFGFAEVGSVCGEATTGNARPRLFRLPEDQALINRLGLNGEGAEAVANRLRQTDFAVPIGLNIAKTNLPDIQGDKAVEDVLKSFDHVKELPLAYVAFNASCPNTHEGIISQRRELDDIFREVQSRNSAKLPLFVKVSPDSSAELLEDIVHIARLHDLSGYICGNTTVSREDLKTSATRVQAIGPGGLSGRPLKQKAVELCRRMAELKDPRQQIIACGGVSSGQDAFDYLQCGATAVQLYTGLVYHGPGIVAKINRELSALLLQAGPNRKSWELV